jgi:alkanesulfonate monooxygenase SsuD/methylene tetrahydromethanopterin reductase-like flavin-dependent oxidoreductase (luciferase family)
MLDEALTILGRAWSGEPVRHRGAHYVVDVITFLPMPVQPTMPVWIAGFPGNVVPLRLAPRFHGYFPVNLTAPDQVAQAVATLSELRVTTGTFDVVVPCATWWLTDFDPEGLTLDRVQGVIDDGPF